MATEESYGSIEQVKHKQGGIVYLIDDDHETLMKRFADIEAEKYIINGYEFRNKHCLLIFVDGNIKIKKKKKTRSNK